MPPFALKARLEERPRHRRIAKPFALIVLAAFAGQACGDSHSPPGGVPSTAPSAQHVSYTRQATSNAAADATLLWESPPFPGPGADGGEDVVGLMRRAPKAGPSEAVAVAWSGQSFKPLWIAGPFGDFSASGFAMRIGVSEDRVIVADAKLNVHVLDRRDGKEIGKATLSDRIDFICAGPPGSRVAWIPTIDRKSVLVNLDTAQPTEAPRPDFCAKANRNGCGSPASCAGQGMERPVDEDVGAYRVFVEGPLTWMQTFGGAPPIARISAVDRAARKATWTNTIAPDPMDVDRAVLGSDLAAGRAFAIYKVLSKAETHLTSFDATGERVWDVPVAIHGTSVLATQTRVYVHSKDALSAFDPKNGRLLGTFQQQP